MDGNNDERENPAINKQAKQDTLLDTVALFVPCVSIGCWWETSGKMVLCVLKHFRKFVSQNCP